MSDLHQILPLPDPAILLDEDSQKTRRVYDLLARVYPLSTYFFHSKAHRCAVELSGIEDGMRVLELATGSGEMFRRLVQANPSGLTIGLDLSPNMAAQTQRDVRKRFPGSRAYCEAVDVRHMPFRDSSFDAVVCCYLFELLPEEDVRRTLCEIRRVLKPGGRFTVVLIGEDSPVFNIGYRICGGLVPSFWGRQVEETAARMVEEALPVVRDRRVRQGYYPSRVLVARKS